jgi:hypothetical protein
MKTHLSGQEMEMLTRLVREASALGGIQLMKQVNRPASLGKAPELVMAECLVAAYRIMVHDGLDEEA